MIGGSIAGYSRIGMRISANRPSTVSIRLMTVAKTGRLIETSDRTTGAPSPSARRSGQRLDDAHGQVVPQALDAADHHRLAGVQPVAHLDLAGQAQAELHLLAPGAAVAHDEDEG